jgi:Mg2+ and Co2+ transporter CorA
MEVTQFKTFEYLFVEGLSDELEESLTDEYGLEELDIEDIFTNTQLSKIEQRKNYLYVALQFPEFEKSKSIFIIKEVHCIISEQYFILIDKNYHKHAIQFNNLRASLFEDAVSSYDLFFEMLDFFVTKDFRAISKFRSETTDLENLIFALDDQNDLIQDLLVLKRNISTFYNVVLPLTAVISDLQSKYSQKLSAIDAEKIDDTLDKLKKMTNNLSTISSHANLLTEANNAIIARSTNQIIKTLTSINIIAIIPTIFFGYFGMNVYFGWNTDTNPWPVVGITILSLTLTGGIFAYFRKRDWL